MVIRTAPGLPFWGPTGLLRDTVGFLFDARQYGDLVRVRALGVDFLLVYRPEVAEHVLVKNQKNYRKDRYIQRAFRVFGNGLLRAEGDTWLKQRRLMQPGFHRQRIQGHAEQMRTISERALDRHTGQVDFHHVMTEVTLEIAVETMFGPHTVSGEVGQHLAAIMNRFEDIGYFFEPDWFPSPGQLRYKRAVRELDRVIDHFIESRKQAPGEDVLSMLLDMRDEHGQPMSRTQIRDEVMTLFIAGHETTALTLAFAWRLLAMHPEVTARLREEVSAHAQSTFETVTQMPLLDKVIKEALRLHPPVYGLPRQAIGADRLGEADIGPDTQVLIAVAAMHRDPTTMFPEPEAFKPDRWTPAMEAALHRYAYFPFGGGPRMCIGAAFADLEAKIVLSTFLRRFEPNILSHEPIDVVSSLTQRPRHGLPALLVAK